MTPSRRARCGLPIVVALALAATSTAGAQGIDAPRVPVRTAIKEINTLRAEYEDLLNKKATAALTAMYLPDAVMIRPDGSTLLGREAIGKSLAEQASSWGKVSISSDSMRVFGNTAWDLGTMTNQGAEGDPSVSHYLVVLRRGVESWKVSSAAVVSETRVTASK